MSLEKLAQINAMYYRETGGQMQPIVVNLNDSGCGLLIGLELRV